MKSIIIFVSQIYELKFLVKISTISLSGAPQNIGVNDEDEIMD